MMSKTPEQMYQRLANQFNGASTHLSEEQDPQDYSWDQSNASSSVANEAP